LRWKLDSFKSFAAGLSAAVRELGLRDFTLVGHSMGGTTVARYALDHPDTLKSLVLLDPAALCCSSIDRPIQGSVRRIAEMGGQEAVGVGA
jgi:pimeloyl-ACP methyl ester carboxylesterase